MKILANFLSIFVLKRLERFDTFRYKISCIKLKGVKMEHSLNCR